MEYQNSKTNKRKIQLKEGKADSKIQKTISNEPEKKKKKKKSKLLKILPEEFLEEAEPILVRIGEQHRVELKPIATQGNPQLGWNNRNKQDTFKFLMNGKEYTVDIEISLDLK